MAQNSMVQNLVNAVRTKYPKVYDKYSDAELAQAVLEKYPQYAASTVPQPVPEGLQRNVERNNAVNQAGNFLLTGPVPQGDGIVSKVARQMVGAGRGVLKTPIRSAYLMSDTADALMHPGTYQGMQMPRYLQNAPVSAILKNGAESESYGGALATGLEYALGGELMKGVTAPLDAGKFLNFLGRAASNAAVSGAVEGANTGSYESARNAAIAGGVLQPVAEGAGYLAKNAGNYALNRALNLPKSVLDRTNPGEYLINKGGYGWQFANGMREQAADEAAQAYNQMSQIAANSKGRVPLQPILNKSDEFMQDFGRQNAPNLLGQGEVLQDVVQNRTELNPYTGRYDLKVPRTPAPNFPNPTVSVPEAVDIQRGLGKAKPWNANPFFEPPAVSMRDAMYGVGKENLLAAEPNLADPMNAYSNLIKVAQSSASKPSIWPEMHAAGYGGIMGEASGHGLLGATAGVAASLFGKSALAAYSLGRLGVNAVPLSRFTLGAGLGASSYSQFNPSDTHGTNLSLNPFGPQ